MFILHEVVFGEKNEEDASSHRNVSFTYSGGDVKLIYNRNNLHIYDMDSLAPIVLYLFVFFNFIINKLNQTSSLFNFSFMRLFLSHNPAKRAALLAV